MNALKRYARTLLCSVGFFAAALVAGCGGGDQGRDPILGLPAADVISIAVTPATAAVDIGASQQYLAIATYTDGSSRDVSINAAWTSDTPAVATVNAATGLAVGVNAGASVIAAAFNGKSGSATLTVNATTLQSIVVLPANPSIVVATSQQFVVIGTFSDNTTRDISALATFTSSAPAVATINASTGLASGLSAGVTTITATSGLQSASTVLTVTAIAPLPPSPPSAPINLRSAANFGVLAGTALTSNSGGTTLIAGDVGSPSQTTDPAQTAGFNNYKSGAILDNALADLQSAISDANGRTCDVNFAGGIDLGGATLTPGVYCYAGAISLTGTLALSGSGVYIFRTASTLNTTSNSIVQLLNGAVADNVTWLPVGPTTLGANSVFKGSILGQAAAITVGDNTTLLNGRVLSGAAVTLRNNQIAK